MDTANSKREQASLIFMMRYPRKERNLTCLPEQANR
jgi:hypothetical protein